MNAVLAEEIATPQGNRLAKLLRWAGAALVLVAGGSFMLQGLEQIAAELRSWSIVGLMLLFSISGYLVQRSFGDAKGARLLFGLAVLLVPVQFSQIAGMIHELQAPGVASSGMLSSVAQLLPSVHSADLGLLTLATVGIGMMVLAAGFRVLARPSARALTLAMMMFSSLLLVPARDSLAGLMVLAVLALGYLVALHAAGLRPAGQSSAHLRTFEGRCAMLLLALPLGIALTRYALHAQTFTALGSLVLLVSVLLAEMPRRLLSNSRVIAALSIVGLGGAALAWLTLVIGWTLGWSSAVAVTLAAGPVLGYWLESSRKLRSGGPLVRFGAGLLLLAVAIGQLEEGTFVAAGWLLALALAVLAWSVLRRYRDPAIAGLVIAALALLQILQLSLTDMVFSGWLVLAGSGLGLVLLASVLERYGSGVVSGARNTWTTVRAWQ
ncbi:MAG: hypothetical protein AB8B93_15205 [Pseudomonadales bacterium]